MTYQSPYDLRQNAVIGRLHAVLLAMGIEGKVIKCGNPFEVEVIVSMDTFETRDDVREALAACWERPEMFGGSSCRVRVYGGDVEAGIARKNTDQLWCERNPKAAAGRRIGEAW